MEFVGICSGTVDCIVDHMFHFYLCLDSTGLTGNYRVLVAFLKSQRDGEEAKDEER